MLEGEDRDVHELNLIDCGIDSLQVAAPRPWLHVLNVHSNSIRKIENLQALTHLKHLDLSSNQISQIEGLSSLLNLKTLNLACNLISVVKDLENLRSLVRVNLSYNQIDDLSGFYAIRGPTYKLNHIDLHGNRIFSMQHVCKCLTGCVNLRSLTLQQSGADNPVCREKDYRKQILGGLEQITCLDSVDRSGQLVSSDDLFSEIPGLDEYLEFLMSNGSSDISPATIPTPRLDKALEAFQNRGPSTPEISSSTITASDIENSFHSNNRYPQTKLPRKIPSNHEKRLELLEKQLATLLSGKISSSSANEHIAPVTKHPAKRDVDYTDESESESTDNKQMGKTRVKQGQAKSGRVGVKTTRRMQGAGSVGFSKASTQRKEPLQQSPGQIKAKASKTLSPHPSRDPAHVRRPSDSPTAVATEVQIREDIQTTYVQLMQELESERERRWKAEQASRKLVDHIKELQSKVKDDHGLQDIAVQATTRLKQALTNEREAKHRLQDELDRLKSEQEESTNQLRSMKETEEEQRRAVQALEQTAAKLEARRAQEKAKQTTELQNAQMRGAALARETELLQNANKTAKSKIEQLQELLADREQEHRKVLEHRYSLDSQELRHVVDREVTKVQANHTRQLQAQHEKVDALMKQYSDLEDEFRMALQIEAQRFQEVQSAFEKMSEETATTKQLLVTTQRKENESSDMVSDLTALVKEQKGRITELSRAKNEQMRDFKERISGLETHVEEARKRMLQLELLKKEKAKLLSENEAQLSVIEGLKSERKLWGQELAQQGASLAQDRGRLDAKIETLTTEVASLKRQLEREADAVKIKTKILEDQTDTIKKLKEGILERDVEIKAAREDALVSQKSVEGQLSAELSANHDLQEKVDRLTERKEELKEQVAALHEQLQEAKKAHSMINSKWKQKSDIISQLEKQVTQMKVSWDTKENKLTEERDKSINAASIAVEKLRSMDDTFRQQLISQQQSHERQLEALRAENEKELSQANLKILAVEDEMRQVLHEHQLSKKAMEERVRRLTSAFTELQHDFS